MAYPVSDTISDTSSCPTFHSLHSHSTSSLPFLLSDFNTSHTYLFPHLLLHKFTSHLIICIFMTIFMTILIPVHICSSLPHTYLHPRPLSQFHASTPYTLLHHNPHSHWIKYSVFRRLRVGLTSALDISNGIV